MKNFDEKVTRIQVYSESGSMMGLIPRTEAEKILQTGNWSVCNGVAIYPKVI